MLAAYTWSKMLDDFSSTAGFLGQVNPGYADNNSRRLDKSLSALDVAHRLTVNYQYALPFGTGRRWINPQQTAELDRGGLEPQRRFRAEFFNLPNAVNLYPPTDLALDFGRPQFGNITQAERARIIQLRLKFHF